MGKTSLFESLEAKHRELDAQVAQLVSRGMPADQPKIAELKSRKLQLKDRIAQLSSRTSKTSEPNRTSP